LDGPVIALFFDCDTGIDDSLALLYLLGRQAGIAADPTGANPTGTDPAATPVTLVGIASTAGNVPTDVVTANNLAWLRVCGRTDIPVHRGAAGPLADDLRTTEDTHGPRGVGYADLPGPATTAHQLDAADAWIAAARRHPGTLVGLVTGPLTSLATAIRRDPELPALLGRLVIMGGAFHTHGNTTPVAEWNVSDDPEAAAEVFEAFSAPRTVDPVVCGLDITESIALTPAHVVALAEAAGSTPAERPAAGDPRGLRSASDNPVIRYVVDALRFYFEFHHDHDEGYIAHLHDPFAAMVALDPEVVDTIPARVAVELAGTLTRGMTVADERSMWPGGPNARIAVRTDTEAVFAELIAVIGGYARRVHESGSTPEHRPPREDG